MYDTIKAIKAQRDYCKANDVPNFAPAFNGECYHCKHNIYEPCKHPDGRVTDGITVERAGKTLITGCPHCRYSFVD